MEFEDVAVVVIVIAIVFFTSQVVIYLPEEHDSSSISKLSHLVGAVKDPVIPINERK